jgi:peptidase T. Metallo peptidase. MEROPS family M20B
MEKVLNRFLNYVSFDTQSDSKTGLTPSTPGQAVFAAQLCKELKAIGLTEVEVDHNGYVMATLPANVLETHPTIGFIAHMDTSPDFTGKNVRPQIIHSYDGNDITLNELENILLKPSEFPELLKYKGQDLVVTDGTTLLGADDKAGIAEILTAMEYLQENPQVKHGKNKSLLHPR